MLTLAALLDVLSHQFGWFLFAIAVLLGVGFGAADMARFRWRRVSAVSEVVLIEAWRRKIWLVTPLAFLGVVVVSQLQKPFDEQDAIRQTIKFCVFATGLVVAMTTIILACTNLPREIENRVIYTVATKPTTRLEIVLGKVWGFAKVSFVILLIMGTLTWAYLSLREWNMRKAIAARLSGTDAASLAASEQTLRYYRDSGLLLAKKQEEPDALQIFARLPEETGSRRYFSGSGDGTMQVGFDIDAASITPPGGDKPAPDGLLVVAAIGYVKKGAATQPAAAATAPAPAVVTTKSATTGPTTVPYYGPFVMSPEERNKLMAGVTGPALEPTVGIDLVDANHETVGAATPIGPIKVIELNNRNGLSRVQALIPPKLTETLKTGRYYVRVTGQSDVEYYVDLDTNVTPEPVKLIVAQANGQLAEIQPIRNPRDASQPASPAFGARSGSFGEQLRGAKDHSPTAVYRFRDAAVQASDGKAPLEFRAGIERSGSEEVDTQGFAGATEVHVRVKKLPAKGDDAIVASEQIIRPESNRPLVFTVPAEVVGDGNFDVQLRTLTQGDFVGLKPNSLVLVTARQPFAWNLLKSMLILWLMSVLITTVGIFTSTFLSWPIAVVFTLVILLAHWGVEQLSDALQPGIGAQVVTDMGIKDPAKAKAFQASIEKLSWALNGFSSILPDISKYAAVEDIERGISIPWAKMRDALGVTLGFGLPLVLLSYVVLKNKEVAP